jgi:hypothetical protein
MNVPIKFDSRAAACGHTYPSSRTVARKASIAAVDFGFKVGLAEFEKSKRYGKQVPLRFPVSIETGSTFFRFQLGLIDRLIDHTMNACRRAVTVLVDSPTGLSLIG